MSDRTYIKAQVQQKTSNGSSKSGLLQRTCACGQHTLAGGECPACRSGHSSLPRSQGASGPPSSSTSTPTQKSIPRVNSDSGGVTHFAHDFSQIPVYSRRRTVLQTKIKVNQPEDVYEQEADQVAEQVMRMTDVELSVPAVPVDAHEAKNSLMRKQSAEPQAHVSPDSSNVPSAVQAVLNSGGGRPLDTTSRAFMEPRFRHNFDQVRVYTDTHAAESARMVNALAYTVGRNVVFGSGQFAPQTTQGRYLLAHELAHVVQQMAQPGTVSGDLFRKKSNTPVLWYQEAADRLKAAEKNEIIPLEVPMLRKFMALIKAVDDEDATAVPELLNDFVTGDSNSLFCLFPSDALANELITRMILLGLNAESARFRTWYLRHSQQAIGRSTARKEYSTEVHLWEDVLERLTGRIPDKDADAAVKVLDALALLFDQLRNEALGLDKEAIKADIERRKSITDIGSGYELHPDMTISLYFLQLVELLQKTFAGIQTTYQVVLDQAIADLGAGKGEKHLQVAKDKLQKLTVLVVPTDQLKQVGGVKLPVTRSEFKKGGGRHLDIFLKGKAAEKRSVKIEFYNVEMSETDAMEKQLDFGRVLAIRRQQIQIVERLYGLEKDQKSGKLTEETKENAAAIAKLGKEGFHLESDNDWRKFLLEKFEAHRAMSGNAEALTAVIKLLETYLHAFTTHTPYNIEDFGDNLLTKTFPRALTGQLIHDCGVYALRIAYILSLLREHPDLQLRFRYIMLPVHIGLIITGNGLPLYIAQNDQFTIYSAAEVAKLDQKWRQTDTQGNPRSPSKKDETEQFLGELAGTEFISGTDLPFKMLDVPHLKGSPATMKRDLWQFYTTMARTKLFGPKTKDPKSPHYQFHLKYLIVLEMMKEYFNTQVVPFWNAAHKIWLIHEPGLSKAWQQLQSAKAGKEKNEAQHHYDELAQQYENVIVKGLRVVEKAFEPSMKAQLEIVQYLKEHPEVIAKDIPTVHSERVEAVFNSVMGTYGQWWQRTVYDHLGDIRNRQKPDAPFAREQDLLGPID
jgi:Domain of unknown function (DUF4157)